VSRRASQPAPVRATVAMAMIAMATTATAAIELRRGRRSAAVLEGNDSAALPEGNDSAAQGWTTAGSAGGIRGPVAGQTAPEALDRLARAVRRAALTPSRTLARQWPPCRLRCRPLRPSLLHLCSSVDSRPSRRTLCLGSSRRPRVYCARDASR